MNGPAWRDWGVKLVVSGSSDAKGTGFNGHPVGLPLWEMQASISNVLYCRIRWFDGTLTQIRRGQDSTALRLGY